VVWLAMVLFLDLILLGAMIKNHIEPELAVSIALANPLQVFRTAALMLFDPQLIVLGPAAYVITDTLGATGFMVYGVVYPLVIGTVCASVGYFIFRRGDLP
ncbi:MAG: ABC transporter permease, partial [Sulfurimicrobium sp.]